MRLTWRDEVATALVAASVAAAVAVGSGWDWPMLGSERAGMAVMAIAGLAACIVGGGTLGATPFRGPLLVTAAGLGGVASLLVIAGIVTGAMWTLAALAGVTVALWVLGTIRHASVHRPFVSGRRQVRHA